MAESGRMFEPRRELGRTGFMATALGIGDVADRSVPLEECVATVRRAMDAGLNVDRHRAGLRGRATASRSSGAALRGRPRRGCSSSTRSTTSTSPSRRRWTGASARLGLDTVGPVRVPRALDDGGLASGIARRAAAMDELGGVRAQRARRGSAGISSHDPEVLRAAIESGAVRRGDVRRRAVRRPAIRRRDPAAGPERAASARSASRPSAPASCWATPPGYNRPLSERPRGKISSGGQRPTARAAAAAPDRGGVRALHADARPGRGAAGHELPERAGRGVCGGACLSAAHASPVGGHRDARLGGGAGKGAVLVESGSHGAPGVSAALASPQDRDAPLQFHPRNQRPWFCWDITIWRIQA